MSEAQVNTPKPPDFSSQEEDSRDELIASLQSDLERERDRRSEERFAWFAALNIIADLLVFPSLTTWSAPMAIVILQMLLLVVLGRKWGVDDIWTLTERLIDKWDGKTGLK